MNTFLVSMLLTVAFLQTVGLAKLTRRYREMQRNLEVLFKAVRDVNRDVEMLRDWSNAIEDS